MGSLSLQMNAGAQFAAHGATWPLSLQYKGHGGAFMNFLTPGKLESHALKPSWREKGPERLSPTPIQKGQAQPFSVPSQSFATKYQHTFFFPPNKFQSLERYSAFQLRIFFA